MRLMIYIVSLIGIGILLFTFFLSQQMPRAYHHTFTKTTDLSKENIEGIYLNTDLNSEEISNKYGKLTEQSRDVIGYDYYELRKGIEIAVNKDGRITRFIITENDLETVKKISIGAEREDVIQSYGKHYYERLEQGFQIIGYTDKKNEISIEFWMVEDQVNSFKLDLQSMK